MLSVKDATVFGKLVVKFEALLKTTNIEDLLRIPVCYNILSLYSRAENPLSHKYVTVMLAPPLRSFYAVNQDCELKILDFGLARLTDDQMTGYVATRWYRVPEIMLNWVHYNQTVNIWSVGCIMAELLTGQTLFPGSDHINQLRSIMTLCGTPRDDLLEKIISQSARNFIKNLPIIPKKEFINVFVGVNPKAVDLLERMLMLDTDCRLTANEAFQHPYLEKFHDPEDEPTAPLYDKTYEDAEISIDEWKQLAYDEIVNSKFSPDFTTDYQ